MTEPARAPSIGVSIRFYTVLVKRECLPSSGFDIAASEHSTGGLAAFMFMGTAELGAFVDDLAARGLRQGADFGVADMMHGPIIHCVGIQYHHEGDEFSLSWTAYRQDHD